MKKFSLYIAMVGLPARGKSTISARLKDNLMDDSIKTRIFNNGDLRRRMIPSNTSFSEFYNPENKAGAAVRENIAHINMDNAKNFLEKGGNVAIIDATNVSSPRRSVIQKRLNDHPILFIECINNDEEVLDASIKRKTETAEFENLSREAAFHSFKERIAYYISIYTPLKTEKNFLKLDTLYNRIIKEEVGESIPFYDRIRDFLVTDTIKNLFVIRHGETYFNLENRIGGDSELTEKGKQQARDMAIYFEKKEIPLIFTSQKKRTIQGAEIIKESQKDCSIVPLEEFNEIDSGLCECMSYEEIRRDMPHVYNARKMDKYNYIYPEGEGYVTMKNRIDRGIKKALFLSNSSKNIMIIGHRAANRMILSHFLFRREEDVPYIYIPQDRFYYVSVTKNKKLFQLKKYN
ncbi:histidine phosphatase family protein [Thermodesulfobacteriota bacterium]